MNIKSRLPGTRSAEQAIGGQQEATSTKQQGSSEGFIDAISVCNCHHAKKSNSTTSNLSLEYQAKANLSGNLPDDYLYMNLAGKSSANPAMQPNLLKKTYEGEEVTRLFEPLPLKEPHREIEKKYVLYGITYKDAVDSVLSILGKSPIEEGESSDIFWTAPGVDFVRLRENTQELTVKVTDRDSIENRLEVNLKVDYNLASDFAHTLFGNQVGAIVKQYAVFQSGNTYISVYYIKGNDELYLEVESDSLTKVDAYSEMLYTIFEMKQEYRSLFDIVFKE